ncbi:hypothetical protein P9112_010601 [Eukaryota sp. TZLM1-RC]
MSASPRLDTDSSQIFYIEQMQQPPSAPPHEKEMEPGTEPPPASSMSNKPDKVSGTGPPPSSPKENVGLSSDTSSALKDAEAHLEPTDYCFFEQLPPLWKQIQKRGRNVGFQTLEMRLRE